MRNRFDRQLKQLNDELIEMGSMIEKSIEKSVVALVTQNVEKAKDVIAFDAEIDRQEREIESLCMKLLLQQQPVARDLRLISSALKMITDMERIGDQSADIAELALMMADKPYIKDLKHISQMGQETMVMVVSSVDAFVEKDLEKAKEVLAHDDLVDDLFDEVKKELIELIHQNMENGEQATDLLMIAKYFERIGDHATNIAEWVIYSITGEHDFSLKSKENEKVM
ncbi:MAG: phosphate signaling complex protein PhoU [Lachnospiraceae bacterium]|nr:phosphate signaling complex protein PhoU [Lachnospiraceae bacterium]